MYFIDVADPIDIGGGHQFTKEMNSIWEMTAHHVRAFKFNLSFVLDFSLSERNNRIFFSWKIGV